MKKTSWTLTIGCRSRRLLYLVIALQCFFTAHAQISKDEQMIRGLVEQAKTNLKAIKQTSNNVFVSGAYDRPLIAGKMTGAPTDLSDVQVQCNGLLIEEPVETKVIPELTNVKRIDKIIRLEISKSGDLAYEFGDFHLEFDKEKQHTIVDGSYLRTWKKFNGEWLQDMLFARPNKY